jgi:hypothetical protein
MRIPIGSSAVLLALVQLAAASPAVAQGDALAAQCQTAGPTLRQHCERAAYAAGITQPRVGVALSGGNPVPGTASTLGTRVGALPRLSLSGRLTAASLEIPDVRTAGTTRSLRIVAPAFNVDGALGVFDGFALLPTVGGFASVDVLAGLGIVPLPGGRGFSDRPVSWMIGSRIGLLRESFLMPGVSVTGSYRRVGDITYGDPQLERSDAFFRMSDLSVLGVRATIGKRVLLVGLAGGLGWDRHTSNVRLAARDPGFIVGGEQIELSQRGLRSSRSTAFVNATWTTLVLNFVGEAGLQAGGTGNPTSNQLRDLVGRRGLYGSLAVRLAL